MSSPGDLEGKVGRDEGDVGLVWEATRRKSVRRAIFQDYDGSIVHGGIQSLLRSDCSLILCGRVPGAVEDVEIASDVSVRVSGEEKVKVVEVIMRT